MLDLILTIVCTTSIGVIIKLAETRVKERMTMLLGNYIVASSIGIIIWQFSSAGSTDDSWTIVIELSKAAWILAPIGGFIFALNFFLLILAVKKRGVALPVTLMRLSAIVPITASIILFHESPSGIQVAGIIGALAAAVLMSLGMHGGEQAVARVKTSALTLVLTSVGLLICFGLGDLIMKLFESYGALDEKPLFLAFLFAFAGISVAFTMGFTRTKVVASDLGWGVVLGIPNLLMSYFIISALAVLPAYTVFPTVAAGTVMLIILIARFVFRESMSVLGYIGIALTIASIFALTPR
jgi:drug/metabolite transporter (DMT)-like permease